MKIASALFGLLAAIGVLSVVNENLYTHFHEIIGMASLCVVLALLAIACAVLDLCLRRPA